MQTWPTRRCNSNRLAIDETLNWSTRTPECPEMFRRSNYDVRVQWKVFYLSDLIWVCSQRSAADLRKTDCTAGIGKGAWMMQFANDLSRADRVWLILEREFFRIPSRTQRNHNLYHSYRTSLMASTLMPRCCQYGVHFREKRCVRSKMCVEYRKREAWRRR